MTDTLTDTLMTSLLSALLWAAPIVIGATVAGALASWALTNLGVADDGLARVARLLSAVALTLAMVPIIGPALSDHAVATWDQALSAEDDHVERSSPQATRATRAADWDRRRPTIGEPGARSQDLRDPATSAVDAPKSASSLTREAPHARTDTDSDAPAPAR